MHIHTLTHTLTYTHTSYLLLQLEKLVVYCRPSHRSVFDRSTQNGGGRPDPFYHMNDISVYLGRQRGGVVPDWKNAFHASVLHFSLNQEWHIFALQTFKTPGLGVENCKIRPAMAPPPFAYCKRWKTGRWEALGMRLSCSKHTFSPSDVHWHVQWFSSVTLHNVSRLVNSSCRPITPDTIASGYLAGTSIVVHMMARTVLQTVAVNALNTK